MLATNISIVTDYGVTLTWTNGQPGQSPEDDTVVEMDPYGHSYLVDSVVTTGAVGNLSFQLKSTNGLSFVRYSSTANSPGDQFFLPTNIFNNPDVVTVPYLIDTNSGRTIIEVDAYDVTDPSNPQFLAKVVKQGSGPEPIFKGTLEIPGVSLVSGVETLEFRATDSGFGQTATDIIVTNNRLVSVPSPVLAFVQNGTNRVAASGGGYGVSFQAQTTATNGTWIVNIYDPSGNLVGSASAAVTNIGQSIVFDDQSTPSTVYSAPYYDISVTVQPPAQTPQAQVSDPPSPVDPHIIRVYLLPPTGNAGSIVGYDDEPSAMPSSSSDKQFVINTLAGGVSQTFELIYQIVNIDNGQWQTIGHATAVPLNDPPGVGWGWRALQAGLSGQSYEVTLPPAYSWSTQTPDRPILGVAVHGHGGEDENGVAIGVQGPDGFSDSTVTAQSLQDDWDFNKNTNAVAIALFTGCRIGAGPFMQFILRDKGQSGQISTSTATANKIRPCFGIAWTQDVSINSLFDQYGFMSYWTLYAADNSGTSFYNSLDAAFNLANNNYPGSVPPGAVWSGTASETLDQFAQ